MIDEPIADRAAGRPRDASIDERVLSTTRQLLEEVGWDDLSMRMVASRTGVGRASIDRRWASKAELVLHAVLGERPDLSPFSGTDLAGWIGWVVRGSHELFTRSDVQAAVPGLLTALRANESLRVALWRNFSAPVTQLYAEHVNPGNTAERHSVDLDARALLTMAAGAALFTSTIAVEDDSPELLTRITDLLTTAVGVSHAH